MSDRGAVQSAPTEKFALSHFDRGEVVSNVMHNRGKIEISDP